MEVVTSSFRLFLWISGIASRDALGHTAGRIAISGTGACARVARLTLFRQWPCNGVTANDIRPFSPSWHSDRVKSLPGRALRPRSGQQTPADGSDQTDESPAVWSLPVWEEVRQRGGELRHRDWLGSRTELQSPATVSGQMPPCATLQSLRFSGQEERLTI